MDSKIGINMSDPAVFKYWSELSQTDPERLNRELHVLVDEVISKAPEKNQPQLRLLQQSIDASMGSDHLANAAILVRASMNSLERLADEVTNYFLEVRRTKEELERGIPLKGEEVIALLTKGK